MKVYVLAHYHGAYKCDYSADEIVSSDVYGVYATFEKASEAANYAELEFQGTLQWVVTIDNGAWRVWKVVSGLDVWFIEELYIMGLPEKST